MEIDIITLFPEMFEGPLTESIVKRAQEKRAVTINLHNLRDWAQDAHKTVDDKPYGGGAGMLIRVDIVEAALNKLKGRNSKVVLLSPQGRTFNQTKAKNLAKLEHLILIAGHYEGFDERIREHLVDEEISIGDFVLTGGELPAMVVTDALIRLLPGVIEKESIEDESHSSKGYLEYPQYTRPTEFKGWRVPEVLTSGNHAKIEKWKQAKSRKKK